MVLRRSYYLMAFLFVFSFLFLLSSCRLKDYKTSPDKRLAEKLISTNNLNSLKNRKGGIIDNKGDAIAAIWLRRAFNSLGSSSFMFNYNQFKKRADIVNIPTYSINVYELIYYHYVMIGDVCSARIYLDKAFNYFIVNGKEVAAYTLPTYYLLMLIKKNQTKKALDTCQYYLSLAEKSDSSENIGRCYELSATIYKEIQMYSLAIFAYEKCISIAKTASNPDSSIYNNINALAEIYLLTGHYDKMEESLVLFDSLVSKEDSKDYLKGTIAVWNALKSSYFLKIDNKDSAQVYIKKMRKMYTENLIPNHLNYETEIRYSEYVGDYKQALSYSDTLLHFYQLDKELSYIGNVQLIRGRLNNQIGNYQQASENYAAYILSKDSLDTVALQQRALAMQVNREIADVQLSEGRIKQKLAENQNITLWVLLISLLVIGILLLFLLAYYIKSKYQLKEYNLKLKDALKRAEEGVRMKENFMHHISHEVRTPLNSIMGFSSVLEEMHPEDKKLHQYLSVIHENGQKLITVIMGILNVSNIQNTMINESFTKVEISKLVTDIIDKYQSKVNANTEIQYISFLPRNFKMPIRLESIKMLLNGIVSNAVKYTDKGVILLQNSLDESKTHLILTIEDTGIGINESDVDKIFNLFFKENKYELGGGTGLFVAQQVAEGHRGTLEYDKEYKDGARFILKLPIESA